MHLDRRIRIQMAIFTTIAVVAMGIMFIAYIKVPALWFGVGTYTVTVQLPEAGGLYQTGNVTYLGTEVGRVDQVRLTDSGVEAVLSLKSGIDIPSDLNADVHSMSAVGEQYVALTPRDPNSRPLKNGDVIQQSRTSVPTDINALLNATNTGLEAIPRDNLKTTIDEAYVALAGLGPEIARFLRGATTLATDSRANLDAVTTVVDKSPALLDSQIETSDSIQAWAANLADVTSQLRSEDPALAGVLERGADTVDQARQLIDELRPTLPVVLANLVTIGKVTIGYHAGIEQILVLLPQNVAYGLSGMVPNLNVPGVGKDYGTVNLHLNINIPPPCVTGFLPPTQRRVQTLEDYPPRPPGDLYCRVPQDSMWNVRGARNYPCETVPGKRAPTAKMCESDEQYVPLNDGNNWKGDPNATLSGQDVPQIFPKPSPAPAAAPSPTPPPIAVAEYDPATGRYVGPDGKVYTQTDLVDGAAENQTWQSMLVPPGS